MAKLKNKIFGFLAMILLFSMLLSCTVSADSFYNYIYDSDNNVVRAPAPVLVSDTLTPGLNSPSDLIVAENGDIYVADKGNNRIVVLDDIGVVKEEISSFEQNGVTDTFNAPGGIFITKNGDLYICDTANSRIVQLDKSRNFVKQITLTSGETLPSDFVFTPSKVGVDSSGRIFVVSTGFNNGLLEFTNDGNFVRYMGATKVTLTPMQLFWRMFSTKKKDRKQCIYRIQ